MPLDRVLVEPLRAALDAADGDPGALLAARSQVLPVFLRDHYGDCVPEDSLYGEFIDATWRVVHGDEQRRCVDIVLAGAAERLAEEAAEEAAVRARAEAGGYLHALPRPRHDDGIMTDLAALRGWFTEALWGDLEPTWWTDITPDHTGEPAVIGLDDDLVAILWLP
ncbi:hypothetical protein [Nannocystis sp. SCPEA4]|uniref:hypothetical protein n=1 Tax=Nannocystis sp. SCPEA4 TaxID=2996787 RepID=UPI00226DA3A9|nr:hypothetical protein [Nannocystis sp. SCPEA4]MCY1058231.1 hypothetical protein [Nannocystis sp. SCPEA4]